ncbi:MAG TPA: GntR family transcriptional regulator [Ktedonobacteraceae bacterium]
MKQIDNSLLSIGGIDAASGVPLYVQLKEMLREQIRSKAWKPGDRIPTEEAIKDHFQVSRATVRQAIAVLEQEGHLIRHQGRGTFVSQPKIEMKLQNFYSFTQDMGERGLHPETRIVMFDVILRRSGVAEILEVPEMEPLVKLIRLRMANGEPIMLETTYVPQRLVPDLTEEDIATHPLYELLENRYQMRLSRAVESFEPILIDEFAAKMLDVPKGSPALYLERIGLLADGQRVELSQSVVRGDRCRYFVELLRS